MSTIAAYEERVRQTLQEWGIAPSFVIDRQQTIQFESDDLVSIGPDMFGREQRLERRTAVQWQAMHETALADGITLSVISGFRSFDYQRGIIERKLTSGLKMEEILRASALPGYSEHHTGRAIDIGTPGSPPLTEALDQTTAYGWLARRAKDFGFRMTYPKGNPFGIMYEPWHWCFNETGG